jgi:hypothetical protein
MLHFIFYAVVAFFIYAFLTSVDWDSAERNTTRKVENTAEDAADTVGNSGVGHAVGDALGRARDLLP